MRKALLITATAFFVLSLSMFCFGQKTRSLETTKDNIEATTKYGLMEAFTEGRGVYLKWQMEVETNNLGFNVFKYEGFRKVQVNPNLVGGGFLRNGVENTYGFRYSYFDPTGNFRTTYVIESLDVAGKTVTSNYIFPSFVKDLTPIAGLSNDAMLKGAAKENLFEKVEPVLPQQLAAEISQNSLPPNMSKQKFIASQPGVKIGVEKEGIYRVTRTELENAGFDVNQPSANWQLFVNGVEQGIIVGNNGAYIEFYGKEVDTNETGRQIYFLINGATNGKRINETIRRPIAGRVNSESFATSAFKKDPKLYLGKLRNGTLSNFFSDKIINATGVTVNFEVNDIDYSVSKTKLEVTIQGLSLLPHNVEFSLNGELLGNLTGINQQNMSLAAEIPTVLLNEGTNSLFFKAVDGGNAISIWDTVKVFYNRRYKSRNNVLSFFTNPSRASTVTGFSSSNIRVFDLTFPDNPSVLRDLNISEDNGSFGVYLPANRSKKFFAVEDSALLQAASITSNNPSSLSTTNFNGEFVVISYKDWMTEANNWANYRVNEGYTTQVVNVEDVYDEFNYGRVSANAIRDFLNFAKNNWQTPPEYTLLIGDTSYDPRDFENRGNINYMPAQMVDTLYEETGSDEAMADFNNDGLAEIAIGRIPARNPAMVTVALNKVMLFEQTVGNAIDRGALFPSDLPNGYDFAGLNQRLANELPPGMPKVAVNRGDPNARATLLAQLDTGKFLVSYSGHGATGVWATVSFFSADDVPNMQNGDNLTIFSMLTCLNGYFLRTTADSLSELLLFKEGGGGVAVWASTGLTTPDIQEVMGKKYMQNFSDSNIERMGDSIMVSKASLVGGRDVRLSWALIGDPLLKIK